MSNELGNDAKKRDNLSLTVQANLQGDDPNRPKTAAYIFNSAGQPIGHAPIGEKGEVSVPISERAVGDSLRVLIGPDFEGRLGQKRLSYDELTRFGATEKRVFFNPRQAEAIAKFDINDAIWRCWFPRFCRVRGRVIQRIFIGGIAVDNPICDAKVHIYEVDPLYRFIQTVPEDILHRIRLELLQERPIIVNPNPPDPPFKGTLPPFEQLFNKLSATNSVVQPEIGGLNLSGAANLRSLSSMSEGSHVHAEAVSSLSHQHLKASETTRLVTGDLAAQLNVASGLQLRKLLLDNVSILKPYICLWPWWIYYSTQLLTTVELDDAGRFDTYIFLGCGFFYDQPDLYFTVEQELSNTPTLIYHPSIQCSTLWDYVCGTEVTLVVTDPRAIPCRQDPLLPDGGVTILAVGRKSLVDIYGSGATPVTVADKGLLKNDIATGYTNAPFGGNTGLVVDFGPSLRHRANPAVPEHYYRWSYRQLNSALAPIGPWTHLTQPVSWHYRLRVGTDIMYPTYPFYHATVGPNINLFEVPPLGSPDGNPDHYWIVLPGNEAEDTPSAYFNTTAAPAGVPLALPVAGKVELRLEIFNGAGVKITNPVAHGIDFRMPRVGLPSSSTFVGTVHTDSVGPANLTVANPMTGTDAGDFYFTLHFDNNPSTAVIDAPSLSGAVIADECGFLRYSDASDPVTINYHAHHPNGHAVYEFQMVKGSPPPAHTESGEVGLAGNFTVTWQSGNGWLPVPPGVPVAGLPHLPSITELLNGCNEAAYNMNLWVTGKATDGWTRVGYDDFFPRAFALAQED